MSKRKAEPKHRYLHYFDILCGVAMVIVAAGFLLGATVSLMFVMLTIMGKTFVTILLAVIIFIAWRASQIRSHDAR